MKVLKEIFACDTHESKRIDIIFLQFLDVHLYMAPSEWLSLYSIFIKFSHDAQYLGTFIFGITFWDDNQLIKLILSIFVESV